MKFSVLLDRHTNHLTVIRLFLCILVIFSHCYVLGNFGNEKILGIGNDKYGNLAVNAFFAISGVLITKSYLRTNTLKNFLFNRFLRIFPGFWFSLVVTSLLIGPFVYYFNQQTLIGYFSGPYSPIDFIWKNLFLKINQTQIRELFAGNHYPFMVNGAVWTLVYEFLCYLLVGFAGWAGLLKTKAPWLISLVLLAICNCFIYSGLLANVSIINSLSALIHFLTYFVSGIVLCLYAEDILVSRRITVIFTAIFLILILNSSHYFFYLSYHFLSPFILVLVVYGWAYFSDESGFEKKMPDVSYGLYIYGWVVQQALISFSLFTQNFISYFIASLFLSFLFAVPSFYLIELPCLKLKKLI